MGFKDRLSFLVPWIKAAETDSDAPPPQLGNDLGMHLLYDGTKAKMDQLLVEGEEDNRPCLEPVEYARICPRSRLRIQLTHE